MVVPRYRSRTFRRIYTRTPSGNTVIHYKRRRNASPSCANCGNKLPGVARGTITEVRSLAKSSRRPERPYGGVLCSACTRRTIIAKARAET
ncbi:MAG TPA: 50S ribosomal protein L34e [Candidatus Nanoarchaeia archaeon]|nr:50S ribosomal protein L34e [Candidatus Nanoarchaeia archaeon]